MRMTLNPRVMRWLLVKWESTILRVFTMVFQLLCFTLGFRFHFVNQSPPLLPIIELYPFTNYRAKWFRNRADGFSIAFIARTQSRHTFSLPVLRRSLRVHTLPSHLHHFLDFSESRWLIVLAWKIFPIIAPYIATSMTFNNVERLSWIYYSKAREPNQGFRTKLFTSLELLLRFLFLLRVPKVWNLVSITRQIHFRSKGHHLRSFLKR